MMPDRVDSLTDIDAFRNNILQYAALSSFPISDFLYNHISSRIDYPYAAFSESEHYIDKSGIDRNVFGIFWGGDVFNAIAKQLGGKSREVFNRLRLIYEFTGWPIVNYRRTETFPIADPTFQRYMKLRPLTPKRIRMTAPYACGEAGWKLDGGLVNHDVAIFQERLQFLYFSGVINWLDEISSGSPEILEVGAGCGLFACGLYSVYPNSKYIICDIPTVLMVSFSYLNILLPNVSHAIATPDGLYHFTGNGKAVKSDYHLKYFATVLNLF